MVACILTPRTEIFEFESNHIFKYCKPDHLDQIFCKPISKITCNNQNHDDLWLKIKDEARGTGKTSGDRHPKIGDGVLIGAGTCVLGNIVIGDGEKIGAGSVVLKDVPARATVVGNPARFVGGKNNNVKVDTVPSFTMDHVQHDEWSDYVI
nr:serine acetyltransferase 1, chloroplastic [Tanacetum cinerariifolium]